MNSPDEVAMGLAAKRGGSETESDTKAAIYARTSSVSQKFGYSIDEQLRCCLDRCKMFGWSVTHVYRDEAKSGKDTDRPMFQQMLSHAEAGDFDVLVFWKLDRFSRSIMHAVQLEKEFRDWDVSLHSVTEQIDTTTAAGRFNFRNIANAAEFERELIKQRTKMGHMALALEHKWPNNTPPYGYRKDKEGRLQIISSESDIVSDIFNFYIDLESMPSVAKRLNDDDILAREDMNWTTNTIGTVLRNQIYIGYYTVGDIEKYVPEYQIIPTKVFNRTLKIRYRFQHARGNSRKDMGKGRKETYVNSVLNEYLEYCH